jgi:hypothetical protein
LRVGHSLVRGEKGNKSDQGSNGVTAGHRGRVYQINP